MSSSPANATVLHCEVAGSGAPVVLLHAGIADSRMWRPQVAALASDRQVIAYDLRGFGQSAPASEPFTHTDDLEGVIDALGLGVVDLVGCSFGGMVALDFALSRPERVRSLVMIASRPAGYDTDDDDSPEALAIEAACERGDLAEVNELEIDYWVVGPGRTRADVDPIVIDLILDSNRIALENEDSGACEPGPFTCPDGLAQLPRLRAPLLVLHGKHDRPWVGRAAADMAASVPGTQVVELPDTAHLPGLESPVAVNAVLRAFLGE